MTFGIQLTSHYIYKVKTRDHIHYQNNSCHDKNLAELERSIREPKSNAQYYSQLIKAHLLFKYLDSYIF